MGWLEKKLIVVSVVVDFLYMSTLSFLCSRDIVLLVCEEVFYIKLILTYEAKQSFSLYKLYNFVS